MDYKILVLGGVSYDNIAHVDQFPPAEPGNVYTSAHYEMVGSTSAGKAFNMRQLNLDVRCCAQLGMDSWGEKIRADFAARSIPLTEIIDDAGTERHFNLMDKRGERISIHLSYRTHEPRVNFPEISSQIDQSDLLVFDIINFTRYFLDVAIAAKKPIWTDLHDYDGESSYHEDFIESANCLFLSNDKLKNPLPFMERMVDAGKEFVVCTRGADGAILLDKSGNKIECGLLPDVQMVDTNGAGDAFFSGFLFGHTRGESLQACMALGTICGGMCVTKESIANPNMTPERVVQLWQQHFRD